MAKGKTGALVARRQKMGGVSRAQKGRPRANGWTLAKQALFLETLAETCNVSEAARTAGVSRGGAYDRRADNPAFARAWDQAIEIGYAEIEAMLMREALFGSEVEELTLDGEGAVKGRKVKRTRNLQVALRLLAFHRERMDKRREAREAAAAQRPDSPETIARVEAVLEDIGRRQRELGR